MVDNHPELQQFIQQDVQPTGVHLGTGAYGAVVELCWNGTKCAGKRLHDTLLDSLPSAATSAITGKFVSECKMIAKIRHPNIVQFLGLCFLKDSREQQRLYLMMEKLDDNLCSLLDNRPNIELVVKCSILLDVSRGLVHLHSFKPPIVHRDLSTKNILLTASLQAKIADLGTAKMIGTQKLLHTPMPGTPVFMPPEANGANPECTPKLDVFSFGHVMLHTLTQVFPSELMAPTYQTNSDKTKARTEVDRRARYLEILDQQLGKDHKLYKLTVSCLANEPKKRPDAKEAMKLLEELHSTLKKLRGKSGSVTSETAVMVEDVDGGVGGEGGGGGGGRGGLEEGLGFWDMKMRNRTASFIDSHILKGHPSVLKIYQSGGLFRRNAEWKEFIFKIADKKLQYYSLNNRLQSELELSKVETAKGFWSPNSTEIFPFHIHFKGRGSPWILGAHSNEERQSWMEAIKPGCTLNQWVCPHLRDSPGIVIAPTASEETPPPIPRRTLSDKQSSSHPKAAARAPSEDPPSPKIPPRVAKLDPPKVPPRPDFTTQTSDCTYVPANLLNMPPGAGGTPPGTGRNPPLATGGRGGSVDEAEMQPDSHSPSHPPGYLPLIATTDERGHSVLGSLEQEEEIVRELSTQFSPVQVDLLIQMFKTWMSQNPKDKPSPQQQQISRKISQTSLSSCASLSVSDASELSNPLARRHLGYAKEGKTEPYMCLADIARELGRMQSRDEEASQPRRGSEGGSQGGDRSRSKRQGIYFALTDMLDDSVKETLLSSSPEKEGDEFSYPDVTSSLPRTQSKLLRKNAMRSSTTNTKSKGRPRSISEGNTGLSAQEMESIVSREKSQEPTYLQPVSTLRSVLRRTSIDYMLEDSTELEHHEWFKANTQAVEPTETPKTDRMSTFCENTEYDLFVSRDNLVGFQQIEEGQFGPVYRASIVTSRGCVPVALKPIKSLLVNDGDMENFLKEMSILKCIYHPNVAQVYGLVDQANWIVMEYLLNGDLKSYLIGKQHPVFTLMRFMLDIAMGMHYLSAKGFVHRKLAARNVLVSETEVCKVADLDLGSQNNRLEEESNPASALAANFQEGLKDPNRILRWMAPEILLHQHFSTASDVWSYGILMWEMFNPSQLPYPECDDRVCAERIVQGYMMSVPEACPERVAKIMKACWYQNAASRPSFLYISSLLSSMLTEV